MNWLQMEADITAKVQQMSDLRDRAKKFAVALEASVATVDLTHSMSIYHGMGVELKAQVGYRVARLSFYMDGELVPYKGTRDSQGRRAVSTEDEELVAELLAYLHPQSE